VQTPSNILGYDLSMSSILNQVWGFLARLHH